jgi:hypothetical protein
MGNRFSIADRIRLKIDRSGLPKTTSVVLELVDARNMFPLVDFDLRGKKDTDKNQSMTFEERTRVLTKIGCCDVRLTFEKYSKIEMLCSQRTRLKVVDVKGGVRIVNRGEEQINITSERAVIEFETEPETIHALALRLRFPLDANRNGSHTLVVSQSDLRDRNLGGATAVYRLK